MKVSIEINREVAARMIWNWVWDTYYRDYPTEVYDPKGPYHGELAGFGKNIWNPGKRVYSWLTCYGNSTTIEVEGRKCVLHFEGRRHALPIRKEDAVRVLAYESSEPTWHWHETRDTALPRLEREAFVRANPDIDYGRWLRATPAQRRAMVG